MPCDLRYLLRLDKNSSFSVICSNTSWQIIISKFCSNSFSLNISDAINSPVYYYRQNLNSATGKRALQHGLDYQIVFTNISNVFNLQNFPKETTNIFQRRWTRWIIDLISNYKSQNLKSKDIEAAVYSQPYYTAMMHFIPQGILHRIELWLLKKKYSRGIALYCNIMMHFKHLLKRYKL